MVLSRAAINPIKKIGNATKVVKAFPLLNKSKIPEKSFAPYGAMSTAKIIENVQIGKIVKMEAFANPLNISSFVAPEENLCQFIGLVICNSVLITTTLAVKTIIRSFGNFGTVAKEENDDCQEALGVLLKNKNEPAMSRPTMISLTCISSV